VDLFSGTIARGTQATSKHSFPAPGVARVAAAAAELARARLERREGRLRVRVPREDGPHGRRGPAEALLEALEPRGDERRRPALGVARAARVAERVRAVGPGHAVERLPLAAELAGPGAAARVVAGGLAARRRRGRPLRVERVEPALEPLHLRVVRAPARLPELELLALERDDDVVPVAEAPVLEDGLDERGRRAEPLPEHLDAVRHEVRLDVRGHAHGRAPPHLVRLARGEGLAPAQLQGRVRVLLEEGLGGRRRGRRRPAARAFLRVRRRGGLGAHGSVLGGPVVWGSLRCAGHAHQSGPVGAARGRCR